MKKVISAVTGILVSFSMLSLLPSAAAETKPVNHAVNYGTSEAPVFGPDGLVNLNVSCFKDPDNKDFEEMDFGLYNSKGDRVATWHGNSGGSLTISHLYSDTVINPVYDGKVMVTMNNFAIPAEEEGKVRGIYIDSVTGTETGYVLTNPNYSGANLSLNSGFKAVIKYYIDSAYEKADLVVPAHTFAIYANGDWKGRDVQWGLDFTDYGENDKDYFFAEHQNEVRFEKLPDGAYPYMIFHECSNGSGGASGNIYNRLRVIDKPCEYVKKTINLYNTFPNFFDPEGWTNKEYCNIKNYNCKKSDDAPYKGGGIIIISGNLVNAPIPDDKGNVTIYVEKESQMVNMQTDLLGGGGITNMKETVNKIEEYNFQTLKLPEKGVNIQLLSNDKYTVRAESGSSNYDCVFSIVKSDIYRNTDSQAGVQYVDIFVKNKNLKRTEIVKGDVFYDDKINTFDLVTLQKVILRSENQNEEDKTASDINNDGAVNVFDFMRLKNTLLDNDGELQVAYKLPDDIF